MSDTPAVAVVGTGRMGAAMADRLHQAGLPLTLYNRTRDKAAEVAGRTGAQVAGTPREAAAAADVVLVSLTDDAAVRAAYGGADGLAAGLRPGAVVLETSTVDPQTVAAVRPLVVARDAVLLDTPVSGSVSLVQSGELTVMAGGDVTALGRARVVLDTFASRVFQVGGSGAGATMKLAVNSVLHGLNQALAEALVLAEKAGVGRSAAYQVFAASAIAAPFVQYKRAAFEHPNQAPVAFTLDLAGKDLDLVLALAGRVGARMDQAAANSATVADAIAAGYGDRDLSALSVFLA